MDDYLPQPTTSKNVGLVLCKFLCEFFCDAGAMGTGNELDE